MEAIRITLHKIHKILQWMQSSRFQIEMNALILKQIILPSKQQST